MEIQLRRAYCGDDLFPWNCAVCECGYTPRTVMADIVGEEGDVCPDCLAYLHGRHPELFPSPELLEELAEKYPTPVFPNAEAVMAMEREDLAEAEGLYHESYLWRPRGAVEESRTSSPPTCAGCAWERPGGATDYRRYITI